MLDSVYHHLIYFLKHSVFVLSSFLFKIQSALSLEWMAQGLCSDLSPVQQSWASLVTLNESSFCFHAVLAWKALSRVSWKGGADPSEKLAILKNKSESCEHPRYEKTQAVTYSWSRWCAAQCLRCLNHLIRVFHLQLWTLPVTWISVRFHRSCCGSGLPHSSCAVLILLFSWRCTCKPWHYCCPVSTGSDSCWWESHPFSPSLSCTLFSSF